MRRALAWFAVVATLAAWAGEARTEYRYNESVDRSLFAGGARER
jgi:hypothetical protein